MSITPGQSRAGRALVNWSQGQLSEAAGVARATIAEFESGKRQPIGNNLLAIQNALEKAGVVFVNAGEMTQGYGVTVTAAIHSQEIGRSGR